jgi:hypothetical protein
VTKQNKRKNELLRAHGELGTYIAGVPKMLQDITMVLNNIDRQIQLFNAVHTELTQEKHGYTQPAGSTNSKGSFHTPADLSNHSEKMER